MKIIEKLKMFWHSNKNPSKQEWILLSLILSFCFFTMYYVDIMIILEEGFLLLDCTFSGKMSTFYDYVRGNGHFQIRAVYGMLPYILFAIWALPIWILNKFFLIDIFSEPVLLWFKLLLIIFLFLTIWALKELAEEFEMNESLRKWMIFSFLSSLFLVIPVFEIAQIDIISVALILWGIVYFVRNDHRKFMLMFMLAIPMKLFALFIFVPLILLKEKRVLKIICNLVFVLLPSIVIQLPFPMTLTAKIEKSSFNSDVFSSLTKLSIFDTYADRKTSLFVICFLLLCIWSYTKIIDGKKEYCQYGVFVGFCTFLFLFALFVEAHPYWIVFLAPFIILQCFMCPKSLKLNLLLEMVLEISFIVQSMSVFKWVFGGGETFNYLFLKNFGRRNIGERIHTQYLLDVFEYSKYGVIVNAMFFACAIALIFLFYPKKEHLIKHKTVEVERSVIWFRIVVLIGYLFTVISVVLIDIPTLLKL